MDSLTWPVPNAPAAVARNVRAAHPDIIGAGRHTVVSMADPTSGHEPPISQLTRKAVGISRCSRYRRVRAIPKIADDLGSVGSGVGREWSRGGKRAGRGETVSANYQSAEGGWDRNGLSKSRSRSIIRVVLFPSSIGE